MRITEKALNSMIQTLRSSYGYSKRRDSEAANMLDKLANEIESVRQERDAAVHDLYILANESDEDGIPCLLCKKCDPHCNESDNCFEWRGVCVGNRCD